ncbi:MAG: hypothetical protein E6H01_01675 [Bacillati bacterium ANGP1]|uniref:DUF3618 domain-containing protein n=1 Tax=Candidatus Segetimicrobium genomatis TaxID=2569760 RepID=A0A537LET6_9BACT|nr:MAG: hypothetical protein E6H01_01675 [Terrabacteria group bacterium ANGP1]
MKPGAPDEERIAQLRRQITADLRSLRRTWGTRTQWTRRTADGWVSQAARLRGFPTWAIGVLAGLLAGVWSALRRPRKVE